MGAPEGHTDPSIRRDQAADQRDQAAIERDQAADERDQAADERDRAANERDRAANDDADKAKARNRSSRRERTAPRRRSPVQDSRKSAAADRKAAAADREAAAHDRDLASSAREQDAVERAEEFPGPPTVGASGSPPRGDEVEQPGAPAPSAAVAGDPIGVHQHGLDLVRRAVALAASIAGTEERVAQTLQDMGEHGDRTMSGRRLQLAREATQGARTATEHGARLQALAERSAELAEFSALQSLLHHAGAVLVEVARTEQSIAAALDRLAHLDETQAERRLQESRDAARAAQQALRRAEELHRIAAGPQDETPTQDRER